MFLRRSNLWLAIASLFMLAGCDFDNVPGNILVTATPEPTSGTTTQTVTAGTETTITVSDTKSPIYGTKMVLPAEAIHEGTLSVSIDYSDTPPGALLPEAVADGAVIVSKTFVLAKDRPGSFDKAVLVTVPYESEKLDPDDVPSVLYWNDDTKAYEAVAVRDFDRTAKTVTFATTHFSSYVVAAIKGFGAIVLGKVTGAIGDIDTGFRPAADGFPIPNVSSYTSSGGNCLGMATLADWFFTSAKATAGGGKGLFAITEDADKDGKTREIDDDILTKEFIVRAHAMLSNTWDEWNDNGKNPFSPRKVGNENAALLVLQAMKLTKMPQVFLMWGPDPLPAKPDNEWGHALTAYRYDSKAGELLLYDPNAAGDDTPAIKYEPGKGLTTFNKAAIYPSAPTEYAFEAFHSAYSPADLKTLYDGFTKGWADGTYGEIKITSPAFSDPATRTISFTDPSTVRLQGTLAASGGEKGHEPNTVTVFVAGSRKPAASVKLSGGAFDITLPKLSTAQGTEVLLVGTCEQCPTAGNPVGINSNSLYGTFTMLNLKPSSIENWGFEKGNFDFWRSIRFLLSNGGGGGLVEPSDKSVIVGNGFDPIATDLPMTQFGNYAARVNNSDNGYHVSQIIREIDVPADATAFNLSFSWAAVLEDPQHDPIDQPYVLVNVTDVTSGQTIRAVKYFTNDPSFAGWKSYQSGQWKAIPWQVVNLGDLSPYKGHKLRITIEAADCNQGGHGGYAYFDAFE